MRKLSRAKRHSAGRRILKSRQNRISNSTSAGFSAMLPQKQEIERNTSAGLAAKDQSAPLGQAPAPSPLFEAAGFNRWGSREAAVLDRGRSRTIGCNRLRSKGRRRRELHARADLIGDRMEPPQAQSRGGQVLPNRRSQLRLAQGQSDWYGRAILQSRQCRLRLAEGSKQLICQCACRKRAKLPQRAAMRLATNFRKEARPDLRRSTRNRVIWRHVCQRRVTPHLHGAARSSAFYPARQAMPLRLVSSRPSARVATLLNRL